MTTHPFDTLDLDDGRAAILTPCPGTRGVSLRESLSERAEAGAKSVVTLMPQDQMERNGVAGLPQQRRESGLRWFRFPVDTDAAPGEAFHEARPGDKAEVLAALDRQGVLAVHCRGGSGRTGLMTAILLLERVMSCEQAVAEASWLRPKGLQHDAHVNYLEKWQQ